MVKICMFTEKKRIKEWILVKQKCGFSRWTLTFSSAFLMILKTVSTTKQSATSIYREGGFILIF